MNQHSISQDIFRRCVEDSNDAIMITDTSGVLHFVNRSWCALYGYEVEEALGQTPRLLQSGTQDSNFYGMMWAQIRDPHVGYWKGELVNRCRDGHLVPVLLTITPYKGADGRIEGYMGLAVDLTAQKEMEKNILHQDRLATLGTLATGLAHEIGNPLGVARGRAEFLQMNYSGEERLHKGLEVVIAQIDRISAIIQTMLRLGRAETPDEMDPLDLSSLFNDVRSLFEEKLRLRGIALVTHCKPRQLLVRTHVHALQQVIVNLVLNALQAIDARIEAGEASLAPMSIELRAERHPTQSGRVTVKVSDTGGGIAQELREKVFEPFFTTKVGTGTGLGLAIVDRLMHTLGGTVRITDHFVAHGSERVQGTTFTLELPTDGPEASGPSQTGSGDAGFPGFLGSWNPMRNR